MKAAGLFCSGGKCSYEIKSPSGGARSGGKEDGLTLLSASGTLLTLRRYHNRLEHQVWDVTDVLVMEQMFRLQDDGIL